MDWFLHDHDLPPERLKQLIYCYNYANFTIVFLCENDNFLRCKLHSVRHASLTFTWVKLSKRPAVNIEPTCHSCIMTFMNNGKAFPWWHGMQLPVPWPASVSTGHWQAERYCIYWDLQKLNLLENKPNNSRNNMKFKIKNKKNRSILGITNTNIKQNY